MSNSALVNVSAFPGDIRRYIMLGDTGTATINGMFVNEKGFRTGVVWSTTITTATAKTWQDVYGADIPKDAVGVVFDSDASISFDIVPTNIDINNAGVRALFVTDKAKYPTILSGSAICIGSVA